jgi:hypothetical protein
MIGSPGFRFGCRCLMPPLQLVPSLGVEPIEQISDQ